jgi:hypothetical protein
MNSKKLFLFFLIAVSIGVNVYFRLNSLFLRPLDKEARNDVHTVIAGKLYKEIALNYPDLTETDRNALWGQSFKLYLKEHSLEVQSSVVKKSRELKSYFQDDAGWTYLLEVDPYRWYRRVENYLDNGNFGTTRIGHEDRDNLMLAPFGAQVEPIKLHFYAGVYFYKFLHFINNNLTLEATLAFLPVFLSVFMIISVFCFALLTGVSYSGSFVASLIVGLAPVLLMRSSFGWFDTDTYIIFLPVFIILAVAGSFRASALRQKILFLFLAGLLTGIFSAIWSVWWFIFYIIIVALLIYQLNIIIYDKHKDRKVKIKDSLFSLSWFIFFTYFWVWLISGAEGIKSSFLLPFSMFAFKHSLVLDNFWPPMASLIGELRSTDIPSIVNLLGGNLIFCAGLLGFLSLVVFRKDLVDFKEKGFLSLVLFIWLVVMFFLAQMVVRFAILLLVPVGIFFGVFLDVLTGYIKKIKFYNPLGKNIPGVLCSGIFISAMMFSVHNASKVTIFPLLNDTWKNMLVKIRETTPQDAIINAHWQSGDFIMTIAKRATIQCAQYNGTPVTYWVARALLTENEKEAVAIFRMLDAGNSHAFEEITRLLNNNKFLAMGLINRMLLVDEGQSRILLAQYTSDLNITEKILKLMYKPQHPGYFLADDNLVFVLPTILSPLANWDFKRVDLWQKFRKSQKDKFMVYAQNKFGYTKESSRELCRILGLTNNKNLFSWFSHGAAYKAYTDYSEKSTTSPDEGVVVFDNGLIFDKDKGRVFFKDDWYGKWISPAEIIFVTQRGINQIHNKEGDNGYSCVILEAANSYKAVLLSKEVAHSMLARLYFMKGSGLKYFKLVGQEENKEKNVHLYLYKINWGD